MWNLKKQSPPPKRNQAHRYREQIGGCLKQEMVGGWVGEMSELFFNLNKKFKRHVFIY